MVWVKKTTGRSPGYHPHTREDLKRVGWCLDKNIKIAVVPNGTNWQVEININKSIHLDSPFYSISYFFQISESRLISIVKLGPE